MKQHEYDCDNDLLELSFRGSDNESDDLSIQSEKSSISIQSLVSDNSSVCSGSLELAYVTANMEQNDSFTLENLTIDAMTFPDFGNPTSNTYFEQEYKMDVEIGEPFGGIRGICWRSRYRLNLSQTRNIMSLENTEFIFDITKLISINTESTNELQYKVLNGVAARTPGNFDNANPHIRLPKSKRDADRQFLTGQFGIFKNLPCPTVHIVGDHACMTLKDVLAHHLALARRIQFTESPSCLNKNEVERVYDGIHGCQAM